MDETTQLDWVYDLERTRGERHWLTQPMGGGELREYTFKSALGEVRRIAAHLRSLKLEPGTRIAIFSKNCAWWMLADLAIWMAGHVSIPVYPTLTPASIRQILEHSGARLVFVGKLDGFAAMEPGLADLPRITLPLAPPQSPSAKLTTWQSILESTEPMTESPVRPPHDLATIIYTSGSTGTPKGAMHSFRTMSAAAMFTRELPMLPDDRMISYLPLAHVAERACLETTNFKVGYHVYFAESLETFVTDIQRCRPTIFGSVPRLWQKFQSGVFTKMPPGRLALLLRIPLVNRAVRKKVLKGLGLDAARVFITGSAPTPPELHAWYRSLGVELSEVYGMTENFAVSHFARQGEAKVGATGRAAPGVTVKIADDGEVLVKSPGTMVGYYSAEAMTKETIDADGFLHTGDRGAIDEIGRLQIKGRVKEIFKTSKGKYVAPAPIEGALIADPDIDQACVSGAGMPQPHALVVLSPAVRKRAATERAEIARALSAHLDAVNATLDAHEQLDKLVVIDEEWTPENGLLTPTLKLKRALIEERYAPKLDAWLSSKDAIVWA